jgi:hypothetical protein
MQIVDEREMIRLHRMGRGRHHADPGARRRKFLQQAWLQLSSGLIIFAAAAAFCSLISLKYQLDAAWTRLASEFRFYVLVSGSQLDVDEVERFLQQLDGPTEVVAVSSDDILGVLRKDPLLAEDFNGIAARVLPTSFQVNWPIERMYSQELGDLAEDIRAFPGVVDVAYDGRLLDVIHSIRLHWAQVRVALSVVAVALISFASLLLGRFFFFVPWRSLKPRLLLLATVHGLMAWGLGYLVIHKALGSVPAPLLLGGLVAGFAHFAWLSSRPCQPL